MIKRVCLIVNYNLYESKRHFTEKLAEAMRRKGLETMILDVNERPLELNDVKKIKEFAPDFTCSFNSLAPMNEYEYLWDFLGIPHVSFIVDPAFYSTSLTDSPYSILTCVDRSDVAAMKSLGFNRVFFWPHAIECDIRIETNARPYDVLFLGSCYDHESLRNHWQKQLPAGINRALDDAIDHVLADQYISLADALVSSWDAAGLSTQDIDFGKMYYYLDYYVRGRDRVELIRSIRDVKVHLFGGMMSDEPHFQHDWNYYVGNKTNVTIHPPVNFTEALHLLKQTKISLNSTPSFKEGSHERVFASFACGALPIASHSNYLQEIFGDALPFYRMSQWDQVNEIIKRYLSNEDLRQKTVEKGRTIVLKDHTWDQRVDQLIAGVEKFL